MYNIYEYVFKDTNGIENVEENQDIIKKTRTIWRKKV